MPVYCYIDKDGGTHERVFPMGKAPPEVHTANGPARRSIAAEWAAGGGIPAKWPLISEFAGVPDYQLAEAREYDRSIGAPAVEYVDTKDGFHAVKFETRGQRKAWLRAHGMHDRDGGYGDG